VVRTQAQYSGSEATVHAVALRFPHDNLARIHKTLRITPAMAAGISDHVRLIEEIVGLRHAAEKDAA
jgi:hypothetical protein